MRVILASASPRRRELLRQIFDQYEVIPSQADENIGENDPERLVERLSLRKAGEVYEKVIKEEKQTAGGQTADGILVIGSDTVVAIGGRILGKPKDAGDAAAMLRSLSGQTHQVCTGVTLISGGKEAKHKPEQKPEIITFHEVTDVTFYPMTEEEVADYVASGEPMDKAGAYGIQGLGGRFVRGIDGDYNTVVGLPVARLYHEVKKLQAGES